MRHILIALLASLLFTGPALAKKTIDPAVGELRAELAALENDQLLSQFAAVERLRASQAIDALELADKKQRDHRLFMAQTYLKNARVAAEAEVLEQRGLALDRERDQIMLEASRRDAELARREAERLRMQSMARAEENARLQQIAEIERVASEESLSQARAEADKARELAAARAKEAALARKEAELAAAVMSDALALDAPLPPSTRSGDATVYSLAGDAFPSGSSRLTNDATASLKRLAIELASGNRDIRINGHTDSSGSDKANLAISKRRAESVKKILVESGVDSSRIKTEGFGSARPIDDNSTAAGRSRNRRVEISVD